MFDIKARETIVINSIAFNTYMYDDVTVQLYSREGHVLSRSMTRIFSWFSCWIE
jgi:hypothetical protein